MRRLSRRFYDFAVRASLVQRFIKFYTLSMKMILTGTGTSHGVPVIGCDCAVCTSPNPKNKRFRASAFVTGTAPGSNVVIDTGPEFRLIALKHKINHVDAVLITHSHADHLNGLDDLRIYSHTKSVDPSHPETAKFETEGKGLPIYANANTIVDIKNRFDYIFMPVKEGGGKPKLDLTDVAAFSADNPILAGSLTIIPVPLLHGSLNDSGYLLSETGSDGKVHSIAYLTDTNFVPRQSIELIKEHAGILEHLVIDGLRPEPHSTHFGFEGALEVAEVLKPRNTWLTHITHNMSHAAIELFVTALVKEKFPALNAIVSAGGSVGPAYDGLVLEG